MAEFSPVNDQENELDEIDLSENLLASVYQEQEAKPATQQSIERADKKLTENWQAVLKSPDKDSINAYLKSVNDVIQKRKSLIDPQFLEQEKKTAQLLFPGNERAQDLYLLHLEDPKPFSDELKRVSFISKLTGELPETIEKEDLTSNGFVLELRRQAGAPLESFEDFMGNLKIAHHTSKYFQPGTFSAGINENEIADALLLSKEEFRAFRDRYLATGINKNSLSINNDYLTNQDLEAISKLVEQRSITNLSLSQVDVSRATANGLKYLEQLKGLKSLSAKNTFGDNWLPSINKLTGLESLSLRGKEIDSRLMDISPPGPKITDEGLRTLTNLQHLTNLDLRNTDINGIGLSHFKNLKRLNLRSTKLNDNGLASLKEMKNLEWLSLKFAGNREDNKEQLTNKGLANLQGLTQLTHLCLYGTQNINDKTLAYLSNLTKLQYLDLGNAFMTDVGLANLGNLSELKELHIDHHRDNGYRDKGLTHLKGLKNLEVLSLVDMGSSEFHNTVPILKDLNKLRIVYTIVFYGNNREAEMRVDQDRTELKRSNPQIDIRAFVDGYDREQSDSFKD